MSTERFGLIFDNSNVYRDISISKGDHIRVSPKSLFLSCTHDMMQGEKCGVALCHAKDTYVGRTLGVVIPDLCFILRSDAM